MRNIKTLLLGLYVSCSSVLFAQVDSTLSDSTHNLIVENKQIQEQQQHKKRIVEAVIITVTIGAIVFALYNLRSKN